jgi:hypothetical protein
MTPAQRTLWDGIAGPRYADRALMYNNFIRRIPRFAGAERLPTGGLAIFWDPPPSLPSGYDG